jgi:hypothetical protein
MCHVKSKKFRCKKEYCFKILDHFQCSHKKYGSSIKIRISGGWSSSNNVVHQSNLNMPKSATDREKMKPRKVAQKGKHILEGKSATASAVNKN